MIINQNTKCISVNFSDVIAGTDEYFKFDSSNGDMTPRKCADFRNKSFTITSAEPSADTTINIRPNGTQACYLTIDHDTIYANFDYNIYFWDYCGNARIRLIKNGNTISYTTDALSTTLIFKLCVDVNNCAPISSIVTV